MGHPRRINQCGRASANLDEVSERGDSCSSSSVNASSRERGLKDRLRPLVGWHGIDDQSLRSDKRRASVQSVACGAHAAATAIPT